MSTSNAEFILIVDDTPTNLSVLSQALKSVGYQVRVAVDGESAITKVNNQAPALILLDVQMPGIDGFETCRQLKANPATTNIPVIFMTALADTESKVKGLSLGAVDYITKPFEQEEVLARVKIHLQLKVLTDTLEQQVAERTAALQNAQIHLVQQEKLSALGELVAGVAHEINNPVNFISSNIQPAKEYLTDITKILQLYKHHYPEPVTEIQKAIDETELEFALSDFAKLLDSMELGTERIGHISASLRNFTRSDVESRFLTDLHEGIESTLLILKHRLKCREERPAIQIIRHYYDNLPKIECHPGQINQVFMNILANAIDALEEAWEKDQRQLAIHIYTEIKSQSICVRVADNGLGIDSEVKKRLFSSIFTTKKIGKGTGLGLSISRQIIEEKHQGKLSFNSELGKGSEFLIEIPMP